MEIGLFEEWMRPQVSKMFSEQYGIREETFSILMKNFYEHPFQKDKCIRIIAKEGETITGFQSFFYWPYELDGRTFKSYQSGNSLVHPAYRGKGLFQKMLDYIDNHRVDLGVDFLIGFPIEASKNGLLRNKWKNILNLKWHVKIINPLAFFRAIHIQKLQDTFNTKGSLLNEQTVSIRLTKDQRFTKWRENYSENNKYFHFLHEKGTNTAYFILKISKRNAFINELIIGDMQLNSTNTDFIKEAFRELTAKVRSIPFITLLTIAINEANAHDLLPVLSDLGFLRINKSIFFMVKSFKDEPQIYDPKLWTLYRSDIDTW